MRNREEEVLPEGWYSSCLGRNCMLITKGTTPTSVGYSFQNRGVSFIKIENIRGNSIDHSTIQQFVSLQVHNSLSRSQLRENDILFSIAGSLGKTAIIKNIDLPANTNQALAIIRINDSILNVNYCCYFLQYSRQSICKENARGGAMNNLSLDDIRNIIIPRPPLPEQQRIAARLDLLLGKLKTARTRLDAMGDIIARFRKSVLAEAVSGRLTQEWREEHKVELPSAEELLGMVRAERRAAWEMAELEKMRARGKEPKDEASNKLALENNDSNYLEESELPDCWIVVAWAEYFDIEGGTQPPKSEFNTEPLPGYIRLLQIRDFGEKPVPTYIPETDKLSRCNKDDLLIARYGASLGRIVTGMEGAYNVALVKVIYSRDIIHKKMMMLLLKSDYFQKPILQLSRSAQNGFNKNELSSIILPIPSLPEQSEIVRRVDELFAYADALEKRVYEARALADRLEPSILAKAFRGELSEQVPEEAAEWERTLAELEAASADLVANGKTKRNKKVLDQAAEPKASYATAPKKRGRPRKK